MSKFACIHGHFYQPPRENPWSGRVDSQPSAEPYHDWNERIGAECYAPNAEAEILEPEGRGSRRVNNYSRLSFNFGPTVLTWLESSAPKTYAKIIAADQESALKFGGHGNAIAQAFVHLILPLADPRDQRTVVRWGIHDFKSRFKREPEALWLPETACNDEVLELLIEEGLRYVILSPSQAGRVRPIGSSGPWRDVADGSLDSRGPYRWFEGGARGRFIDIFFYHGPLSAAASFGKLMSDSKACADRIEKAFEGFAEGDALVSIATDGELYGHHHKFSEMGLARLTELDLPRQGVQVVNYGYFLSLHAPRWEVRVKNGPQGLGTAWSCAHGLGRWTMDCGCGADGKRQAWRAPMRRAFGILRGRLDSLVEKKGARVFKNVWSARDDYAGVIRAPGRKSVSKFLSRHLLKDSSGDRALALALMETQKFGLYMFTSCGWFFSDVSGLEMTQNLRYARRAAQLAREIGGEDFEPDFLKALKQAPGHFPEFPTGAEVYEKLAARPRTS